MKTPSSHKSTIADHELTGDELDQVSGGFSFVGSFGSLGAGVSFGPLGAGAGVAHGGPNGDIYGTVYGGGSPVSSGGVGGLGTSGGAQANLAFGFGDHNFEDVVTGPSTVVEFGFGSVAYNSNGFTVGLGVAGVGVSHSDTINLSHPPVSPEVQENLNALNGPDHSADLNQPPPQLTDWSNSFGDHELQGNHGTQDAAGDHGATADHGTQDAAGDHGATADHGTQDNAGDHGNQDAGDHGTQDTSADHGTQDAAGDHGADDNTADHGNQDGGDHGTQDTSADHGTQDAAGDHGADDNTADHGAQDGGDHGTQDIADDHGTQDAAGDHGADDGSTFGNDFGDVNSGSGDFGGGDFGGDFGGGDFA